MDSILPELILQRIDQAEFEAHLDPAEMSNTIRVWQVAPICTEWTAVVPVRAGHEEAARRLVGEALARVPGPDGGRPRNAVGLLERNEGRRGMRYDPGERSKWPDASLYLEFMPAGSDMVYAHYALAYRILAIAAPCLVDARWYALLSQCEDVLDCWEIAGGSLRFERLLTEENWGREVLELLDPSISAVER